MLGDGLITEEVFTVQAAAELLQKTKHIVDAVHHGEAEKVLLPIKCGWRSRNGDDSRRLEAVFKHAYVIFYSAPPQVKWLQNKATERIESNT